MGVFYTFAQKIRFYSSQIKSRKIIIIYNFNYLDDSDIIWLDFLAIFLLNVSRFLEMSEKKKCYSSDIMPRKESFKI